SGAVGSLPVALRAVGLRPRLVVSSSFRCRHGVGAVLFVTQPSRPLDSVLATQSLCWTGSGGVRRRRLDTRARRVPVSCSGRCAQRCSFPLPRLSSVRVPRSPHRRVARFSDRLIVPLPSTWGCLDPRRCRPPRSVWCSSHDLLGPAHFTVCDSYSSRLRSGGVSSIADASCHGCRFLRFAVLMRSVFVPPSVRVAA